jgi:hypothetical protein
MVDYLMCKESSAVSRVSGPLKAGFPLLRHTSKVVSVVAGSLKAEFPPLRPPDRDY